MSSTMTTTLGTSNMRTALRQTRTNPTRTSKTLGSSLRQNSLVSNPPAAPPPNAQEHGFYPAITHFTDAITALPREFRRHTSLLKEVDAKAWAPEAHLQTLLAACVTSNPPNTLSDGMQSSTHPNEAIPNRTIHTNNTDGTMNPMVDNTSSASTHSHQDQQSFEHRKLFYHLRTTLSEMMVSMDEKNHLINSANEDLSRHLKRLNTIYPHIADEISEEARLGSLTHWAYIEDKPPTRTNAASSRREAAAGLAAMHETDIASRSESRREAMLARKQRQTQVDSDFDDQRPTKRANANGKSRRGGEIAAESVPGLGISGVAPIVKRKRAEKPVGGAAMERSLSGVLGGRAMSREPSQQEGTKKRKAATAATTAARKRINTANSATNSPKLASSPLGGSFGKDAHKNSPIPGTVRLPSARARQNSTQGRPPSSASNKNNGNGTRRVTASTPELHSVSAVMGKSTDEIRSTTKESVNNKGERIIEEERGTLANGTNGVKGAILLERRGSKGGASNYKREEASASEDNTLSSKTKSAASPRAPAQPTPNTNVNSTTMSSRPEREREQRPSRARSSKTSTPIVNTFAESEAANRENHRADAKFKRPASSSSRSARNKDPLHDSLSPSGLPPKRSHKKGAGLAAQAAVLQAKLARQSSNKADSNLADDHNALDSNSANHSISTSNSTTSPTTTSATNNLNHTSTASSSSNNNNNNNNNKNKAATPSPPPNSAIEPLDIDMQENKLGEEAEEEEEEAEETLDSSGEEPRYCYCQQVSYGEMVACDADDCPREWFHLECVGLGRAPGRNARWFCEECKERLKVAGNVGGAGGVAGGNGMVNGQALAQGQGQGQGQGTAQVQAQAQAVGGRRGR